MPSPAGWRELPCVECGARTRDIDFGDRCPACRGRRQRRARLVARRWALGAAALTAAWVLMRPATSPTATGYAIAGVLAVFVLVYKIADRVAMELLK